MLFAAPPRSRRQDRLGYQKKSKLSSYRRWSLPPVSFAAPPDPGDKIAGAAEVDPSSYRRRSSPVLFAAPQDPGTRSRGYQKIESLLGCRRRSSPPLFAAAPRSRRPDRRGYRTAGGLAAGALGSPGDPGEKIAGATRKSNLSSYRRRSSPPVCFALRPQDPGDKIAGDTRKIESLFVPPAVFAAGVFRRAPKSRRQDRRGYRRVGRLAVSPQSLPVK